MCDNFYLEIFLLFFRSLFLIKQVFILQKQQQQQQQPNAMYPPPLFKDMPKFDSPFHRTGLGVTYPGYGPSILHAPGLGTPFVPPNHVTSFAPKVSGATWSEFFYEDFFIQIRKISNHLKIACELHKKKIPFIFHTTHTQTQLIFITNDNRYYWQTLGFFFNINIQNTLNRLR